MGATPIADARIPLLRRIAFTYVTFLVLMLLMPFRMSADQGLVAANAARIASLWFAESVISVSVLADMLQNVVLFVPFGVLCRAAGVRVGRVTFAGLLVSLGAETMQLFMPGRCPSVFDLSGNVIGACMGAYLFRPLRTPLDWALRVTLGLFPVRAAPYCAALLLIGALGALFAQVVPVGGLRWLESAPVYLGRMPGGTVTWRGTIHRIALWSEAVKGSAIASDGALRPAIDIDFRGGPRAGVCAPLPADAVWSDSGISPGDTPVMLAREQADALSTVLGGGGPFSLCVWLSPERLDFRQEGTILGAGTDTWHCGGALGQRGPDIAFFCRTTVSGYDWDKPAFVAQDVAGVDASQEWLFTFDGATLRGRINGKDCVKELPLRWWATPAGLLLASPAVVEPLTFYATLFLIYAFFAAMRVPSGARGMAVFAVTALALPAAGVVVLTWICAVPLEIYALAAVPLGGAFGGLLGRGWTCAVKARC